MEYAIVDIETAGGNPKRRGITEIAVVDSYLRAVSKNIRTLLNPKWRSLPTSNGLYRNR
jgi:DNA polymerase-3 subunit epsilon